MPSRTAWRWRTLRHAAQLRVWFCAKGLRAHAELAALARARRDSDALHRWLDRARELIGIARGAAAEASAITPNAAGWLALAEAEYARTGGEADAAAWAEAVETWDELERPPLAAYCRWRLAEALVSAGAPRTEASVPLQEAYAVATRIGARPLAGELELLAQRARLDLARAGRGVGRGNAGLRGDPRAHTARGGGPHARRARLHQSRDRRDARHQRQDGERPCLAHPSQAGCAEPARGGSGCAPARPAAAHEVTSEKLWRSRRLVPIRCLGLPRGSRRPSRAMSRPAP